MCPAPSAVFAVHVASAASRCAKVGRYGYVVTQALLSTVGARLTPVRGKTEVKKGKEKKLKKGSTGRFENQEKGQENGRKERRLNGCAKTAEAKQQKLFLGWLTQHL